MNPAGEAAAIQLSARKVPRHYRYPEGARDKKSRRGRVREEREGRSERSNALPPPRWWLVRKARERCRKGKTLSRRVQKAKHRKSLKRAGTFDANLCSGSSFSSGTPCRRRYEDTPLRFSLARSTPKRAKRESVKEFFVRMLRSIPHPFSSLAFSRHDNSPVFPLHFDQPGLFSLSLSLARSSNGYREFIREYEPAIYNSLGCLSGKRRGATNPMVNIKQRYCIGSVRIRFDVPPPPASVS